MAYKPSVASRSTQTKDTIAPVHSIWPVAFGFPQKKNFFPNSQPFFCDLFLVRSSCIIMYSVTVCSLVHLVTFFILCKWWSTFLATISMFLLRTKNEGNEESISQFFFRLAVHSVPLNNQKQDGAGSSPCAFPSLICNESSTTTTIRWALFYRTRSSWIVYITSSFQSLLVVIVEPKCYTV